MTPADLDRLEALYAKATKGVWLQQKTDWESGFVTVAHVGEFRVGVETGIKGGNYRDHDFGGDVDDAALIAALHNAFPALLEAARKAPRWIPVEERFPPVGEPVVAHWNFKSVDIYECPDAIACWDGRVWHNPDDDADDYSPPAYWMPLPASPQKEEGK